MAIDNTICTAGDHNYLWGLFLLIASMRRFGMDEPVIVGTKGFTDRDRRVLEQFGGVAFAYSRSTTPPIRPPATRRR